MGFQINGEEWLPESTAEHTASIMTEVNRILEEQDVRDSEGNLVRLTQSFSNALYLFVLAAAARFKDNDDKLNEAINSFNISVCDDQQIENLLPMAAISRNSGSYSTLVLAVTASSEGDCVVPEGTRAPYLDGFFVVKATTVVSAGSTVNIDTVYNQIGSVAVLAGEVDHFENSIPNCESVTNPTSSVPGVEPETTPELRRRILRGETIKYSLDGCRLALEELTGIAYAQVYFNYFSDTTDVLPGGVELAPRTAYIVISGESDKIAETYAQYMSAPTQNADETAPEAHSQNYVTASGQIIPIKYDAAAEVYIHVRVSIKNTAEYNTEVVNQIKRDLILSSASWYIGEQITAALCTSPFVGINYTEVAYVEVSADGNTWTNTIESDCNAIARVRDNTIQVRRLT